MGFPLLVASLVCVAREETLLQGMGWGFLVCAACTELLEGAPPLGTVTFPWSFTLAALCPLGYFYELRAPVLFSAGFSIALTIYYVLALFYPEDLCEP